MDKFWKKAVSVTGPVAVIAAVVVVFITVIYREEIIKQFGSEYALYITIGIIVLLASALIVAILKYRGLPSKENHSEPHQINTAKILKSKVDGDIVFGDKTINRDKNRDE